MRYRRVKVNGGTYFFTVVTYQRSGILCEMENVQLLRNSFKTVMEKHPFTIDAMVVLPDHLHCIWTLPPDDSDYSKRWRLIKASFSRQCNEKYKQRIISESRKNKKELAVWQRRFWEHLIRDDKDLKQHVEYIHYNPVKHGYVKTPKEWRFSSFHSYVRNGFRNIDWTAFEQDDFSLNGQME